jgi:hypothetical protein
MNYVYAGYGITAAVLILYSLRVVMRGRALRRALPPSPHDPRPSGGERVARP